MSDARPDASLLATGALDELRAACEPSTFDRERMRARLVPALAAGAASPIAQRAELGMVRRLGMTRDAAAALSIKGLALIAVVATIAAVVHVRRSAAAALPRGSRAAAASELGSGSAGAAREAPTPVADAAAGSSAGTAPTRPAEAAQASPARGTSAPARERVRHVAARRSRVAPPAAAIPARTLAASAAPAPLGDDTLALEARILRRAAVALDRHDLPAALAALREHEQSFPNGALARERRALRLRCVTGAR